MNKKVSWWKTFLCKILGHKPCYVQYSKRVHDGTCKKKGNNVYKRMCRKMRPNDGHIVWRWRKECLRCGKKLQ